LPCPLISKTPIHTPFSLLAKEVADNEKRIIKLIIL
jgi:hypothetical protein